MHHLAKVIKQFEKEFASFQKWSQPITSKMLQFLIKLPNTSRNQKFIIVN